MKRSMKSGEEKQPRLIPNAYEIIRDAAILEVLPKPFSGGQETGEKCL